MKKFAISALLLFSFVLVRAQTYSSRWQYSYGGDQQDELVTMIPRPGGLFFFAGTSGSSSTCTRNSNAYGDNDYVVMLFNNTGTKLWERSFGGDGSDQLHDAAVVPSGGYILVGETQSGISGNKTSGSAGRGDLWVVRIDDFGSLVWERNFGGADFESGQRVLNAPDGGFFIAGQVSYTVTSGSGGPSDYQVWKIDANGNLQWTKIYGGSRTEHLTDLKATSDGNYLISGESDSPPDGTKTYFQLGGTDIWIVKIAPDGTQIWDKDFGSSIDDTRGRLTLLADGNMLIVDNSVGMGRLRKIDLNGQEIWLTTCINSTKKDVFEAAAEDPITRNLYVGGMSNSGLDGCKNSDFIGGGSSDVWVTIYDSLGHKIEDMDFGGNDLDLINDISYLNGEIWVTGLSRSPANGNKTSANCGNSADGWILRLYRKFYITAPGAVCNTSIDGKVQFTTVADFLPGNRFTVQLSDPNGDFSHALELGHLDALHTDSIPIIFPPGLPAGTGYRLRLYSSLPTDTSSNLSFTIHGTPAGLLGRDTSLCVGARMKLVTGEQPLETSFLWQDNSTSNTFMVDHVGLFWCEAVNACGISRDSILIVAGEKAVPDLGPDRSFCEGEPFDLQGGVRTPGARQFWNTGDTSAILRSALAGNYWLEISNTCGSWRDSIQMTMLPKPPVMLEAFAVICRGTNTRLDAGAGQISYHWSTGDTTSMIETSITGMYKVTVTDTRGCKASGETEITRVVDPPSAFLGGDTAICTYGSIRLKPDAGYEGYLWNDGSAGHFLVADHPGLYWLQVTDRDGCRGRDSVLVSLLDCATGLFVPSGFTPNRDGLNDRFHPLLRGPWTEFQCSVYDRYGALVFRSQDPADSWDGMVKGLPASSGTFTWVCRFTLAGKAPQTQKGTVVLIR